MTRQYGLELIASRKRALRVAKLASRTVRAIVDPPECPEKFCLLFVYRIVPDHGGHHNRKSL
jgi:hypothetical protein